MTERLAVLDTNRLAVRTLTGNACDKIVRRSTETYSAGTLLSSFEAALELGKLLHEVEIRRDEGSTSFEVVVSLVEGQPSAVHEVRDTNGG